MDRDRIMHLASAVVAVAIAAAIAAVVVAAGVRASVWIWPGG